MANYLVNAFSLNMMPAVPASITTEPLSLEEAEKFYWGFTVIPAIGHADTAALAASLLGAGPEQGIEAEAAKRPSVALKSGDRLLVLQYSGHRLPEGAKALPEGAAVKWVLVRVTF